MMFHSSGLALIWTIAVSVGFLSCLASPSDDCQLLTSTVPITRLTTTIHHGYPVNILCQDEIQLNKCEGTCESSVSPSVTTHPGFKKNCRCCKETNTTRTEVILRNCLNNGKHFPHQHKLTVQEITGCRCQRCTG